MWYVHIDAGVTFDVVLREDERTGKPVRTHSSHASSDAKTLAQSQLSHFY